MVRAVTILVLAMALAAPGSAQIYRWTDANGVEHFSADLDAVPPAHRAAAEASAGRASGGGFTRYRAPAAPAPALEEPVESADPAAQHEGEDEDERIGGHDEAWWRERYQRYVIEIEELEAVEERCEGVGVPSHGTKRQHRERKMEAVNRCAQSRSTLDVKRLQLENFVENARRKGVPPGWVR